MTFTSDAMGTTLRLVIGLLVLFVAVLKGTGRYFWAYAACELALAVLFVGSGWLHRPAFARFGEWLSREAIKTYAKPAFAVLTLVIGLWQFETAYLAPNIFWAAPDGDDNGACTASDLDPGVYLTVGRAGVCANPAATPWIIQLKGTRGNYTQTTHKINTQTRHTGGLFSNGSSAAAPNIVQGVPGEPRPVLTFSGGWIHHGANGTDQTFRRNRIKYREFNYAGFMTTGHQAFYALGSDLYFEDCEISGSSLAANAGSQFGIFTRASDLVDNHVEVRRCKFHDLGSYSVYGMPPNSIFEYNEVYRTRNAGIQIQYDQGNNVIRYNYIHDILLRNENGTGTTCYGIYDPGYSDRGGVTRSPNVKIHDNIIKPNCPVGSNTAAILFYDGDAPLVANNLVILQSHERFIDFHNWSVPTINASIVNNIVVGGTTNLFANLAPGGNGQLATYTATHNACTAAQNCSTSSNGSVAPSKVTITNLASVTVSATDFTHKVGGAGINVGTAVSTKNCNGTCDLGPYETWGLAAGGVTIDNDATNGTVFMDVPFAMNGRTPATGSGTFTVACTGCGTPTVLVNALKSGADSIYRLLLGGISGGACNAAHPYTVSGSGLRDSANIGGAGVLTNQLMTAFTGAAVNETCTGVGTAPPVTGLRIHHLFDEGTGTTAADEETTAGGDEPSTLVDEPTWVAGKTGTAVHFAEAATPDPKLVTQYGDGIDPSSEAFTACFGVKLDAATAATQKIIFGTGLGTDQRHYVGVWNGTYKLGVKNSAFSTGSGSEFQATTSWTRICVRNNANEASDTAGRVRLFVGGVKGDTSGASYKDLTSFALSGDFAFGAASGWGGGYLGGYAIDDYVFLDGVSLTDEEIAEDAEAYIPPPPAPAGTYIMAAARGLNPWLKAGALEYLAAANAAFGVRPNGYFAVDVQIDGDGVGIEPAGFRMHYQFRCAGSLLVVPDSFGAHNFKFLGFSRTGSRLASANPDYVLTGVKTLIHGQALFNSDAVPVAAFTNGSSIVNRYFFHIGPDAVPTTDYFCLVPVNQNGTELGSLTPAGGMRVNVSRRNGSGA